MVTLRSAKPTCAGSIPARASTLVYGIRIRKRDAPAPVYESRIRVLPCPGGEIGIHARLKIEWRKPCGFDSRPGHKDIERSGMALCPGARKLLCVRAGFENP
jgi:hypothetical protein